MTNSHALSSGRFSVLCNNLRIILLGLNYAPPHIIIEKHFERGARLIFLFSELGN